MKKITILLICLILSFSAAGCSKTSGHTDILTTTAPLYEFTTALCGGTELTVDCLISESISCLHDYTLQTKPTSPTTELSAWQN